MSFIELINYLITNVFGAEFCLIPLSEIYTRIDSITDWHLLFFDYKVVVSLAVYFSLFYFIYFVFMYLPYRLFKKLICRK